MQELDTKNLRCGDIGYHGKPIEALTREELMEALLELTQIVYNCASTNNQCKAILTINQSKKKTADKRSGKDRRSNKNRRKGGTSSYSGPEKRGIKYRRDDKNRRDR